MVERDRGGFRVVVVCFVNSVHAVRSVRPLVELGWDVHVVASHPHWADPGWKGVTLHLDPGFEPPPLDPSTEVERLAPAKDDSDAVIDGLSWPQRVGALAELIDRLRPDLVDTMEIQHAGYLMLEARERAAVAPPWLVHNWGSDVYYYGAAERHRGRLRGVLSSCDFYAAECHRDVGLARAFGFRGQVMPVLPNPGGIDLERARELRAPGPPSRRRTVSLKATDQFVYRPRTALAALERCGGELAGHRLALYTATEEMVTAAGELAARHGAELEVVSRADAPVPHEEILALHGRSRVSISLSRSDAICTSFLEAMTMGSLPVQSDTGCSAAWAEDGTGALFVGPDDVEGVAAAIRRGLTDDELVDAAAERNWETARARLDGELLRARARDAYERVAAEIRGERAPGGGASIERLRELAAVRGIAGAGVRREELALALLEPEADRDGGERAAALLAEAWQGVPRGEVADDLRWALGRRLELDRGRDGAVAADDLDGTGGISHDAELRERDAQIESLRGHVASLQGSLDTFHRRLEAEEAAAATPTPRPAEPGPARRLGRKLRPALRRAFDRARERRR